MKRYTIVGDEWAKESPTGDWVAADDALALERERDQLQLMLKFADARINTMLVERRAKPRSTPCP